MHVGLPLFVNANNSHSTKAPSTHTIANGSIALTKQSNTMQCLANTAALFVESLIILESDVQRSPVLVVWDIILDSSMATLPGAWSAVNSPVLCIAKPVVYPDTTKMSSIGSSILHGKTDCLPKISLRDLQEFRCPNHQDQIWKYGTASCSICFEQHRQTTTEQANERAVAYLNKY
jgi:hypothetical protein